MNRRGFLGAMLGAMAAPAVVKAENLMKIFVPPEKKIWTLDMLGADFDGDVQYGFGVDAHADAIIRKIQRNAVYGAHMKTFSGRSLYTRDLENKSLTTRLREEYDAASRVMVTPRRDGPPREKSLDLQLTIQRIVPRLVRL